MSAVVCPDESEMYLLAILDAADGLDLSEFCWFDPEREDGCYRAWPHQWRWYVCDDPQQIDQGARATGKSVGIKMRAFAFPFYFEGQSMLLTAPELNHLRPLTDMVEKALLTTRLMREMLPDGKGHGIARQPHWQARFKNGSSLVSRLPNKDGKGVKGTHVINIEMDECFPQNTLILTRRGMVPIQDVEPGTDQVLTHRNRWRTVTDRFTRERQTVTVRGQGHPGLRCSTNHKFWAMTSEDRYVTSESDRLERRRTFSAPDFTPISELGEGGWWCSPLTFPKVKGGNIPSLRGHSGPQHGWVPIVDVADPRTYWMVGLYLAEGSLGSSIPGEPLNRLTFSIHQDEVDEVCKRFADIGLFPVGPYPVGAGLGVNLVLQRAEHRELVEWLPRHFGRLAHHVQIPAWALGLPRECREQLLAGLVYGDGFYDPDGRYTAGRWKLTTVSRALAITCRLLALSLDYSVSMYWSDTSQREATLRGRVIKGDGFFQVVGNIGGQGHALENRRYTGIRAVIPTGETETLYDLAVEEDHSFIAEGFIVSNSQNYPLAGWIEIVETLNAGLPGAAWRCHGVSRGIRDKFFEKTQPGSGWTVHRPMAMHRPSWGPAEREAKTKEYGSSRQSIDYRRNIYGEHGDAANSVFVLARLMAIVDTDEGSTYNQDIYTRIKLEFEDFPEGASDDERTAIIHSKIDLPGTHLHGYSQKVNGVEVGAPKGYSFWWGGMDVGVTNHPSELMIFGQRTGSDFLELLLRIQMHRINTDDQMTVVHAVMAFYGDRIKLGIDKTGVGFPIWDQLTRAPSFGPRIYGFGFSEKRVVAFEDRELTGAETIKDLAKFRNVVEASTDWLRNDYVDAKKFRLPYDREVLQEYQGQVYVVQRDNGDPYGSGTRRIYSGGTFHSLDASKMMIATKHIPPLEQMLETRPVQESVLDVFVGM